APPTAALYPLSLHDALPIYGGGRVFWLGDVGVEQAPYELAVAESIEAAQAEKNLLPKSWIVAATLDGAPPHGPPRACLSLRAPRSEEHTSELQSRGHLVCRL